MYFFEKIVEIKKIKGFTLIELLLVISIISLLSTVVISVTGSARAKSRDSKRIQDLKQLQIALELYYDRYGCYPKSASSIAGGQFALRSTLLNPCPIYNDDNATFDLQCNFGGAGSAKEKLEYSLQVLIDANFIKSIPIDPLNKDLPNNKRVCYNYSSQGQNTTYVSGIRCNNQTRDNYEYALIFSLEDSKVNLPIATSSTLSHIVDYCLTGQLKQ